MCSGTELPANLSMFLKSISSNTKPGELVREDAFKRDEINALRGAVANSQKRVNSLTEQERQNLGQLLKDAQKMPVDQLLNYEGGYIPAGRVVSAINRRVSPTIQYRDYDLLGPGESIADRSPVANALNPNYSMATTIGRAKYESDENGNLHVIDTYDFPGAEDTKKKSLIQKLSKALAPNKAGWSPLFQIAHKAAEQMSKPMNMDIQLQHGASGEW